MTNVERLINVNPGDAEIERRQYDVLGNRILTSTGSGQTRFVFSPDTNYSFATEAIRGSTNPASTVQMRTSASYDSNTGLKTSWTDENGRTTSAVYEAGSVRVQRVTRSTGAVMDVQYDDLGLAVTIIFRDETGAVASQRRMVRNGAMRVRRDEGIGPNGVVEAVETRYTSTGRVWQKSQPFSAGETPVWTEYAYDALDRLTSVRMPDGSVWRNFYNEAARPGASSADPADTVRTVDPWGRESWFQMDGFGRLTQVIEPYANGSGSVFDAGAVPTTLEYDPLGRITRIVQGPAQLQVREFRYDLIGRLTQQRVPEKDPTLDEAGLYGFESAGWTDVFQYSENPTVITHIDARGVRTMYEYGNDPFGRIRTILYDATSLGDVSHPVLPAAPVTIDYMEQGDLTRPLRMTQQEVVIPPPPALHTLEFSYDVEGRLQAVDSRLPQRPPFVIGWSYDSLNRLRRLDYPAQYGVSGSPRGVVEYAYDGMSRIESVMGAPDGSPVYATNIRYQTGGRVAGLILGADSAEPVSESYAWESAVGLLQSERIDRGAETIFDVRYEYYRPGTTTGLTGQLCRRVDNLDAARTEIYSYDTLGRLLAMARGSLGSPVLEQRYAYDTFGNRTTVIATDTGGELPADMRDGIRDLSYAPATNRISSPGFEYDATGNLTRAQRRDGSWVRYQYDAAGRLRRILDDGGQELETFGYGVDGRRLWSQTGTARRGLYRYYVWDGDALLAEYSYAYPGSAQLPEWGASYIYVGSRLLAVTDRTGVPTYQHPDRLSTRLTTSPGSTNVSRQMTFPFGVLNAEETTRATERPFTTYLRSPATGLDYAMNRYYDSQQGRFTQVDPAQMAFADPADPQTLNMYAYCVNDPINLTDPSGLRFESRCSMVMEVELESATLEWRCEPLYVPDPEPQQPSERGGGRSQAGDPDDRGLNVRGKNDACRRERRQYERAANTYASKRNTLLARQHAEAEARVRARVARVQVYDNAANPPASPIGGPVGSAIKGGVRGVITGQNIVAAEEALLSAEHNTAAAQIDADIAAADLRDAQETLDACTGR